MRRPVFAITDFSHYTGSRLAGFGLNVGIKMRGNPNFLTPEVPPDDITTSANILVASISDAAGGDIVAVARMHDAEKALIALMKKEVHYINTVAYNNQVAIDSSGFHSSADESTLSTPPEQSVVVATQGSNAGTAVINITPGKGSKTFTVLLYPENIAPPVAMAGGFRFAGDAKGVVVLTTTHPNITVSGLNSRMLYNVVVFGANSAGISPLSNPVDVLVK